MLDHDVARRVVDAVLAGRDVMLAGSADAQPVLEAAAQALAARQCRALQVSAHAPGGLSLSGLMAQVAQQPCPQAQDDEVLERGSKALTDPGGTCGCIVLLVTGAAAMQPSALRYLQFACRTAPALRLVLAGAEGLSGLEGTELSVLRARLAGALAIAAAAGETVSPPASWDREDDLPPDVPQVIPLPSSTPRLVIADAPLPGLLLYESALREPVLQEPLLQEPVLRSSATRRPAVDKAPAGSAPRSAPPLPTARPPLSAPARKRPAAAWAAIGLGMASCVALGVAIGRRYGSEAAPPLPISVNAATPQRVQVPSTTEPASLVQPQSPAAPARALDVAPAPPQLPAVPHPVEAQPSLQSGTPTPASQAPIPPTPDRVAAQPSNEVIRPMPSVLPRRRPDAVLRQADTRPREAAIPYAPPQSRLPRPPQQDMRERADAGSGYGYAAPPRLRPDLSNPGWEPSGDRRPILGTYTVGPDGTRTFQSIP